MAHRRTALAASVLIFIGVLSGCVAEAGAGPTTTPGATSSGTATPTVTGTPSTSPSPTATAAAAKIPTDCRAMLTASVIAEFGTTPLNDPAVGVSTGLATGAQPDGSLVCLWRDPGADTTYLSTVISFSSRGPALDMLNELAATQGFTCYTPDKGTRCEKTWPNPTYPVTDGRTLFWRDDILIDTQFSNLAPAGYTEAIVTSIFG